MVVLILGMWLFINIIYKLCFTKRLKVDRSDTNKVPGTRYYPKSLKMENQKRMVPSESSQAVPCSGND